MFLLCVIFAFDFGALQSKSLIFCSFTEFVYYQQLKVLWFIKWGYPSYSDKLGYPERCHNHCFTFNCFWLNYLFEVVFHFQKSCGRLPFLKICGRLLFSKILLFLLLIALVALFIFEVVFLQKN